MTEETDESGTLLNSIYTELYITEGQSEDVNTQHEVRQFETVSKKKTVHDTPIKCHNIFKPTSVRMWWSFPYRVRLTLTLTQIYIFLLSQHMVICKRF